MSHSLVVLPDDAPDAILDVVSRASRSLSIKMADITDVAFINALAACRLRGVDVRIMLNRPPANGKERKNRQMLWAAGIELVESNPAFETTHEKSIVMDGEAAFVLTLDWIPENRIDARGYAVATTCPEEVAEISKCFEADWFRRGFEPDECSHLIWCSGDGRDRIVHFIDHARHTLLIQSERFQDPIVIERLVRAKRRGVTVSVMAPPPHAHAAERAVEGVGALRILKDAGISVHKPTGLKLCANVLLADDARAIIGSIDQTPASFDRHRELAIELHNEAILERLRVATDSDWRNSLPLDLTDEGVMNSTGEIEPRRPRSSLSL